MMAESNNWSELPVELLCMVDQRLFKLKDAIRFRATCKSWRRTLNSDRGGKFRQSLPWLMLPYCSGDANSMMAAEGCKGSDSCRRFFDVAEQKFHHIELPQVLDKTTCRGSAFGWVLTLQRTPLMFLLNPLTGDQIALPPITSFPDVLKFRPEKIGHEYLWLDGSGDKRAKGKKSFESGSITKMALSADPAAGEKKDFVVMVIRRGLDDERLAFCRPRVEEATWTLVPRLGPRPVAFTDVVFWRGQFYVLDNFFRLFVCDVSIAGGHPRLRLLIDRKRTTDLSENYYLSVSPTGDELMMVTRNIRYPEDEDVHQHEDVGEDVDHHVHLFPIPHDVEDDEADRIAPDEDSDDERRVDPEVSLDRRVQWTIRFKVFKLNEETKKWDEVRSIGEYALFLGFNTSTFVSARDHPEIVPNSIYFTDDMLDYHYKKLLGGSDMGIFSLSTGSVQPLYDVRSVHNNPQFISPFPVWFLPSKFLFDVSHFLFSKRAFRVLRCRDGKLPTHG
ncbi:unnamed protein product [Linum trigynum]|uniref:KIB1-4 beta-propeller domain-containing protein n=1 Tax=Linum trigynum TaxID=586398 RepID=A0AAV2EYC8_9ROSI